MCSGNPYPRYISTAKSALNFRSTRYKKKKKKNCFSLKNKARNNDVPEHVWMYNINIPVDLDRGNRCSRLLCTYK